jgi:quinol monooxygenase YgiN
MSEIIEWVLEMEVRDGQGDQVQPLLDDITKAALVDEPRTLHCEFYMSDDRRSCTVLERYADNDAVMAHFAQFGGRFAERFTQLFIPARLTVYGPANDSVMMALAGFGATRMDRVAGFQR